MDFCEGAQKVTIKGKILTGYTTLMIVLCIIVLVLAVLWLNPTILSHPTSVPVGKPKIQQYSKAIQLTSGAWSDRAPIWSPDGKSLLFSKNNLTEISG